MRIIAVFAAIIAFAAIASFCRSPSLPLASYDAPSERAKGIINSIEHGQWSDVRRCGYGAELKDGNYYITLGRSEATIKYVNREIDYLSRSDLYHINIAAKAFLGRIDAAKAREDENGFNRFR